MEKISNTEKSWNTFDGRVVEVSWDDGIFSGDEGWEVRVYAGALEIAGGVLDATDLESAVAEAARRYGCPVGG